MKENRVAQNKEIFHKTHPGSVSRKFQFGFFPVY
ncbi:hypothetical protein T07_11720 [Trichinella nelsoni]|uniref:Uncharacterized protein n=1 Tax=Trichinella nelsoni TaxID=6336 RepID=A0A0V0RC37_9BILA|nr:hypothetical protein T07_11720 [Trichinella nelsoni]